MTESTKDLGVAMALLTRFTTQKLPRALALKDKVGHGELLDDADIRFLHEVFDTAEQIRPWVERLPEYQSVYAQAVELYREITEQALVNEQNAHPAD
ncbi:hypothetical protein [Methylomagnum sp.]